MVKILHLFKYASNLALVWLSCGHGFRLGWVSRDGRANDGRLSLLICQTILIKKIYFAKILSISK
jgi:hypothetical protein